jgi:hypothetical protein
MLDNPTKQDLDSVYRVADMPFAGDPGYIETTALAGSDTALAHKDAIPGRVMLLKGR